MKKDIILKAENISKQYRLGLIGTGTISHDLNRWWHKIRGKEDPYLKVGDVNDRSSAGSSEYVWALQNINFEVERGEVLGIIGKNGAGKSTLLKILSRVTSPTTGEIKTKGRIASLLEVGTGFHPELTGRENIYLNGAILGMTKKEIASKIDEIIEFSGCERYIDTPVKRYSSGMTVRLAFAVAAFLEPDILVIDEVLAVGDVEFQKKAIGKMQDISRGEGRTVLFVSHNMTAVRNLCKKTILLEEGTISVIGETEGVVDKYLANSTIDNTLQELNSKFIESVEVLNNPIFIGGDFRIKIVFNNSFKEKIDYCFVGVQNDEQRRVFSTGTHLDKNFNSVFKHNDSLICSIKSINVTAGRYKAFVAIGTLSPKQNLEVVQDAFSFDIVDNNFFNNGISLNRKQGDVIFKPKWSINEE